MRPAGLCLPFCALLLGACSSSAPQPVPHVDIQVAPVKDRTSLLPLNGRTGTHTVPDHLMDVAKLPGGTVGDYEAGSSKYQMFIAEADNNQKAAFLLLDLKGAMQNAEYIPYMGGYSGTLNSQPAFVFAKLQYLAGVVGLPKDKADPLARQLAARLR